MIIDRIVAYRQNVHVYRNKFCNLCSCLLLKCMQNSILWNSCTFMVWKKVENLHFYSTNDVNCELALLCALGWNVGRLLYRWVEYGICNLCWFGLDKSQAYTCNIYVFQLHAQVGKMFDSLYFYCEKVVFLRHGNYTFANRSCLIKSSQR